MGMEGSPAAIDGAPGGAAATFEPVVQANWARMVAMAYAIVGDWPTAKDIAQESLEAAWRRRGALGDPDKLVPWLLTICSRMALSWRRLRRGRHSPPPAGAGEGADPAFDPVDQDMTAGFARCSRRQRTVLVLQY